MSDYVTRRIAEIKASPILVAPTPRPEPYFMPVVPVEKSPPTLGYIYFITAAYSGRVKIGFTKDIGKRLPVLQTGSHEDLTLQASFRSTQTAERMIHARFNEDRIRGEWFHLSGEIEEFWDDIMDYQGMNAGGKTGSDFLANMDKVFVPLDALAIILDTINEPWPEALLRPAPDTAPL